MHAHKKTNIYYIPPNAQTYTIIHIMRSASITVNLVKRRTKKTVGISQKIFETYPLSFFWDTMEYWNIPFSIWDIQMSENLGYKIYWNIPKKYGTY